MDATTEHLFSHKVKTADEVRALVGPRPRAQKVIMCHGTFDIVHPGHIRHLLYARSKADILIASLTGDEHIQKGDLRPYVPEQLRAVNLSAMEMVDYVIIDRDATPLKNLALIQPDYFAKGYEYAGSTGTLHPKTSEEIAVLESYGGEMIFTPGDTVYSSSALLDLARPAIAVEKLMVLMQAEGVTFADLRATLGKLNGLRAHVVGDTIVDTYTYCSPLGGINKTPTISVRFDRKVDYAGGAAVVAKHLRAAGADVTFSTVLGDDPLKNFVLGDLASHGVRCLHVTDATRPTTNKNVIIAEGYRLLKVDTLDNRSISDRIVEQLSHQIGETATDSVVFSDFRHGVFNRRTIARLTKAIPSGVFRVADSQVASRWGNILEFEDFDLITPNEREARFALGDQDSVIRPLALELHSRARCKTLILKLGDRGTITYRPAAPGDFRAFFAIDSFAEHVVDAIGAGDALLAYATLALVASRNDVIASILGNMAAAVECEHDGNVPVTPEQVLGKLDRFEKSVEYQR